MAVGNITNFDIHFYGCPTDLQGTYLIRHVVWSYTPFSCYKTGVNDASKKFQNVVKRILSMSGS